MSTSWFNFWKKEQNTASVAKDRLQIIVARERTACSENPGYMAKLQQELLQVIAKYEKVDLDRVKVNVDKCGDTDVLELSISLPESEQPPQRVSQRIVYA